MGGRVPPRPPNNLSTAYGNLMQFKIYCKEIQYLIVVLALNVDFFVMITVYHKFVSDCLYITQADRQMQ